MAKEADSGRTPRRTRRTPTLRTPRRRTMLAAGALVLGCIATVGYQATAQTIGAMTGSKAGPDRIPAPSDKSVENDATKLVKQGRQIFRFDTFGDEKFWGDTLHLNEAIAGQKNGGVGPGVSPKTALSVGLKVDVDALPLATRKAIAAGQVNLDDPAVTLALLKLDSVVGVKGLFASDGTLRSVGIECALCHSTVDDSFAPGIGKRLDGWANRDLNVGAIVSLSPNLQPIADLLHTDVATVKTVLAAWGPGKFDAQLFLDGKAFRPDGSTAATLIPPAFGLQGVNQHTSTGWGSVTYWNAFVANLEMHGQGTFYDPRLDDAEQFPIAAENKFGHVKAPVDLISPKLPALQAYQLAIAAPKPPRTTFDSGAAARGKKLFMGQASCSTCHVPPTFTEPGFNMHPGSDIGIDNFQADRSPTHMYRTSPLAGLWSHQKGGFYHDGRFADLGAVVRHYDKTFKLGLTAAQQADLVQYLKSL
jgi:mono/diheme cytochrome c family protein